MEHNDATWFREYKTDTDGKNEQAQVQILQKKLKILKKIANWKDPGSDGVLEFWVKNFNSIHKMLAWKQKHHSGRLKFLYKKINRREMKQASTTPLHLSP